MAKRIEGWDVIGDVHGRLGALRSLLQKMGYAEQGGVWQHPARKAVFIGDLVDRGDEIPGVLALVKAMADAGEAEVLLGNHEFNLLCWYESDGQGSFLRPHKPNALKQAAKSVEYLDGAPDDRSLYFDWFRRLPITLELAGARFVHAYWGAAEVAALDGRRSLNDCGWGDPSFRKQPLGKAVERLIKGPEVRLPEALFIVDRQGQVRKDARIKWWLEVQGRSMRESLLPDTPHFENRPFPEDELGAYERLPPDEPMVFFGHYGFKEFPGVLAPNAVCVDYQGADKAGIGAYRWNGEQTVRARELREVKGANE